MRYARCMAPAAGAARRRPGPRRQAAGREPGGLRPAAGRGHVQRASLARDRRQIPTGRSASPAVPGQHVQLLQAELPPTGARCASCRSTAHRRPSTLSAHGPYRMAATGSGRRRVRHRAAAGQRQRHAAPGRHRRDRGVLASRCWSPALIGTAWVRVSLRPLRRVAATATRVTELPLASGEVALPERVPDANPATEVGQVGAAFNRMLGHVEAALARRAASEAPAAPVRRRRQPRAAHAAGRDPRLRRAGPAPPGSGAARTSRTRWAGWSRSRRG